MLKKTYLFRYILACLVLVTLSYFYYFWKQDAKLLPKLTNSTSAPSVALEAVIDNGDGKAVVGHDLTSISDQSTLHQPKLFLSLYNNEFTQVPDLLVRVVPDKQAKFHRPLPSNVVAGHLTSTFVWRVPTIPDKGVQFVALPFFTKVLDVHQLSFTIEFSQGTHRIGIVHLGPSLQTNTINGFSFSFSRTLRDQAVPSTEGNYVNYQISNSDSQIAKSTITISIPLKNTSIGFTLADNIKPDGNPNDIQTTMLNGHSGQTITYRQDTNYPGDIPVHARITYELYPTKFENSPLMIRYFRDDQDVTLDNDWKIVRDSINF